MDIPGDGAEQARDYAAHDMRVLHFPKDYAVGELIERLSGDGPDSWTSFGEARGPIGVPPDMQLGLWYDVDDLSPLAALQPDDLYSLNLITTTVRDAELAHLRGLTGLRQLFLSGFPTITDRGLVYLGWLNDLQDLSLDGSEITDAGLIYLQDLTALRTLDLSFTGIDGTGLIHIRSATSLRELKLSDTLVDDTGAACLPQFANLRSLRLDGTGITDAGLAHLARLTALEWLHLSGTKISTYGIAALRRELPRCHVYYNHSLS